MYTSYTFIGFIDLSTACLDFSHTRLRFENVAYSTNGVNDIGLATCVEFATQVIDVDLDDVQASLVIVAPDALKDNFFGQDLSSMLHEQL